MYRIVAAIALVSVVAAAPGDLEKAEALYRQTRYREALALAQPLIGTNPTALITAGKAAYGLEDFKRATDFFERAVAAVPSSSAAHHWLGRAFGRRAETAFPLAAPGYASKARQNFEKAVQLNPANGEALNDLFEYYLQAPGFLGGGPDKAQALLPRIRAVDPAEEAFAASKLYEARKDFPAAEQHLRRAAELAPKSVGRLLDVAKFLARRSRVPESMQWLEQAAKLAPKNPQVLFETARVYIESKQNLPAARTLLQQYLQAQLNPDLPSREDAQKLLKQAGGA